MSTYRKEWPCCDSVTETEAWEPEQCPFCTAQPRPAIDQDTLAGVRRYLNDVLAEGTPNEQAVARTVSRMLAEPPASGVKGTFNDQGEKA